MVAGRFPPVMSRLVRRACQDLQGRGDAPEFAPYSTAEGAVGEFPHGALNSLKRIFRAGGGRGARPQTAGRITQNGVTSKTLTTPLFSLAEKMNSEPSTLR